MAKAWIRGDDVIRSMNNNPSGSYCSAVHSCTSCYVIIAWYARVKTESVVGKTSSVPFVSFLHFQANNVCDEWSLIGLLSGSRSHSGSQNDHGNMRFRPLSWRTCRYDIMPPRPTGQWSSYPHYTINVSCSSLSPVLSSFSAHVEWPDSMSELRSVCCRSYQRIYVGSMAKKSEGTVVPVRVTTVHVAKVEVWWYTSTYSY